MTIQKRIHTQMVEVITMKTENLLRQGVLLGLKVRDTVSLHDLVTEASMTVGMEHEISSLRKEMQKIMELQTNSEQLQQMYVSPTSVALVMYLDCPLKPIPDVSRPEMIQFILTKLEDTIRDYINRARAEKVVLQGECDYAVFEEPSLWTGVEPTEEEPERPLTEQSDNVIHTDAIVENLICIRKYFEDMFGQEDTFTTLMNEFKVNGV